LSRRNASPQHGRIGSKGEAIMARMFRDRGSFKSSELIALFLLSFFGSSLMFLFLAMFKRLLDLIFGPTTSL
jgi:hypothetical protein